MLYFRGVRFYETDKPPSTPKLVSKTYSTLKGHKVEFHFYKEQVEDLVFKRGKIQHKHFVCYVVQACFPGEMPDSLRSLNNLKFFMPKSRSKHLNDDLLVEQLLSVYLNLLHEKLSVSGSLA